MSPPRRLRDDIRDCPYQFRKVDGTWQRRHRKPNGKYGQWRQLVVRTSRQRRRGTAASRKIWVWRDV